jgi:hypothetical protein
LLSIIPATSGWTSDQAEAAVESEKEQYALKTFWTSADEDALEMIDSKRDTQSRVRMRALMPGMDV